ncbi:MAG TPA: polysaccharide deacetylase [Candidatus Competibacteraceae bacterium]|nr:polysaccharide deacetylase [Candidatus Competibacteraceae bacterium]
MRRFRGLFGLLAVLAVGLSAGGYWLLQGFPVAPPSPSTATAISAPPVANVQPPSPPSVSSSSEPRPEPVVPEPSSDPPKATPPAMASSPAVVEPPLSRAGSDPAASAQTPAKPAAASVPQQACWSQERPRDGSNPKKIKRAASDPLPSEDLQPPPTPLTTALSRSIRYVKPRNGEKLVALTFDLCEQADAVSGYDAALVNYLRDQQVKATFFAGGKWMRSHPDRTMQLMVDPLFELGNHTWTHANLRVVNGAKMIEQIDKTQREYGMLRERLLQSARASAFAAQLAANVPPRLRLFRFPYGACNGASLAAVNQQGLAAIQWNIVTGDPAKGQSARGIARVVLDQIRPGSIVIAHANGRGWHTAEALPSIVPALRARGYQFVTVSELLARGEPVTAESCYESKPGDNLRYDRRLRASLKR